MATEQEVDEAIAAAYAARQTMAAMPAHERAAILERVGEQLKARQEEAARLIALEAAKPITTAKGEVARTIQTYKFAAEEAKRIHGKRCRLTPRRAGNIASP